MNLGELRTRCEHRSRDLTNVLTSKEVWDGHINAAYLDFLARSEYPLEFVIETLAFASGDASKDLESHAFRVLDVRNRTDDVILKPLHSFRALRATFSDLQATGDPSHYRLLAKALYLFPIPNRAIDVSVWTYGQPDPLVDDADDPILPLRYHEAIVVGAVGKAHKDDQNFDASGAFEREFAGYVKEARDEFGSPPQEGYMPLPARTR